MADIRVTSTGRPFYQIDNGVAKLLLEAFPASFEKIEPKPAPTHNVQQANPSAPRWVVRNHPLTNAPELVLAILNQEQRYPGPGIAPTADGAQTAFTASGHPVPTDVLDKFSALLELANANNPDAINDARARAQNRQHAREDQERGAQRRLAGE